MTTFAELAPRVLRKLFAGDEAPDAADLVIALEKLRAVHASLKKEDLLRWTQVDLPDWAEEPYVMMAAFLGAPDFGLPPDGGFWQLGMMEIRSGIRLRNNGVVCAEYF